MKLLVVDVQKGITDNRLYKYDTFINNVNVLINNARVNKIEVIFIQHDDGPGTGFSIGDEEFQISDKIIPIDNEKVFIKTVNSCFGNKELAKYLENEDTLIIVGLQTNFCIDATIKTAFDNGYRIIVPKYANSTFDNAYMDAKTTYEYYNEMMWPNRFAECISVEETIKLMEKLY